MAALHDILEDTPCPADAIREAFGEKILLAVQALTRLEGESYEDFIARLVGNPLAAEVKLADLRHNSDLSRLREPTDKDRARAQKYARAIAVLEAARAAPA